MQSLGVQQFHKLLAGFEDKGAQAVCTFAYSEGPGHEPIIFQGRTKVRQISNPSPADKACTDWHNRARLLKLVAPPTLVSLLFAC